MDAEKNNARIKRALLTEGRTEALTKVAKIYFAAGAFFAFFIFFAFLAMIVFQIKVKKK
jgi:phosphate starvation-inducible membrane PsiE